MKFKIIIDQENEEQIVATVRETSSLTEQIESLVQQWNGTDKFIAYTDGNTVLLPFHKIECITVIDGKTCAISASGEVLHVKQRLYQTELLLPASFIRINKSSIANLDYLERFTSTYAGGINAVFRSGFTEYVSRRCFSQIRRRLETR